MSYLGSETTSPFSGITTIDSSDGSLVFSPTTGPVVDGTVNTAHSFAWTALHTFNTVLPTSALMPSSGGDFVIKDYVDAFNQGLIPYLACKYATTGPINLATNGLTPVDTGVIIAGDRILVKDQVSQLENGVYIAAVGAWARATDFDQTAEILQGAYFAIQSGTVNMNTRWAQYLFKPSMDTINVDPIAFTFISQSGIGTVGGTGTDNHIMRWDGSTNAQDSTIVISDSVGGITTISSADAIYFETISPGFEFQVNSAGGIFLYAGTNVGGGQGYMIEIAAGTAGPTGIGGPLLLTAGQGGSTSGRGGHLLITGGSADPFGLNSNGGDVSITAGAKSGTGTEGKIRIYFPGAGFSANLDSSLISGTDKDFFFPDIAGTFVVSNTTTDDKTIPRYDGTSGKLVQDSELTISDIAFGVVTLGTKTSSFHISPLGDGNELRLFIPNTTVGSAGPINIYGGTGFGGGSGSPIEITGGGGGATGVGGYIAITGGQGGGTSGAGATVSLTGGSASAGNSNGGNVDLYGGLQAGLGTKGRIRILDNPFSIFAAQFDASLIAISTKTFTFPNLTGTFALTSMNLGSFAATTSAQLASIITDETGSGSLVFGTSPTITSATLVTPNIGVAVGTSVTVTGGLTSSGIAGIGYANGAGGSVTQLTNKATAVTLNRICGQITTTNSNLANNTTVTFTLNNTTIGANDEILVSIKSGGTIGAYQVWKSSSAVNICTISIRNVSGGALAQALVLQFTVIKSVII